MYTAYTWDHNRNCWEFEDAADSKWQLRTIIIRLRQHYDDVSFLITRGTASELGYFAREREEV